MGDQTVSAALATVDQQACDAMAERLRTASERAPAPADDPEGRWRSDYLDNPEVVPLNFTKCFAILEATGGGSLEGRSILDIGCGGGGFVTQARSLGMRPVGIDIYSGQAHSRAAAEGLLRAHGVPEEDLAGIVREGDITEPVGDLADRFDFAISIGMLEHIPEADARRRAVENMIRVLKPGGTLLLVCGPNRRMPFDLFHYGPRFPFYHQLPARLKAPYMRRLIKPRRPDLNEVQTATDFLTGVTIGEIERAIRTVSPAADVAQAFPTFVRMAVTRSWLRRPAVQTGVQALSRALVRAKAEPLILIVATRR
ncbi:SAM-dependent methyltransferase [Patulibacter defluvii]|uniref:SAM-dependent methyltransferase n=1 Tax=Patulibacter defluvii TaxID=3095358 RepID=UPI002A759CD6|nr:class I SAM-dependent methyltransferase [Patulibacter sp. DM4]